MPAKANSKNGITEMHDGLEKQRAAGALLYETYALGLLADACITNGRYGQAFDFLSQAEQRLESERDSDRFYASEIYRLFGEANLRSGKDVARAEQYFSQGLAIAREQGSKSFELRLLNERVRSGRVTTHRLVS